MAFAAGLRHDHAPEATGYAMITRANAMITAMGRRGGGSQGGAVADHRLGGGRPALGVLAREHPPGDRHGRVDGVAGTHRLAGLERVLGNREMLDEVVELLCLHATRV